MPSMSIGSRMPVWIRSRVVGGGHARAPRRGRSRAGTRSRRSATAGSWLSEVVIGRSRTCASSGWPTEAWIVFHVRRSSAMANGIGLRGRRGPPRAPACDGSRTGPGRGVPSASAARTAQPGSPSWRQSRNRQPSGEVGDVGERGRRGRPTAPATPSERMPGVSMRSAPPGSRTSSRWVVVWRPRESSSRTAPVRWRSLPSSALTSVDLPTPEEPSTTAVRPGGRWSSARAATPSPVSAEIVRTSTPGATASAATRSPSGSSATSALLSTITGVAPPVHATAR